MQTNLAGVCFSPERFEFQMKGREMGILTTAWKWFVCFFE